MANSHYKVLILGAGTGGISAAARLVRGFGANQVAIVEPSQFHYYQPLWTLVGAGVVKKQSTERRMSDIIPKGVDWIQDRVSKVDPQMRTVECARMGSISYDYLIVATGLKLDFHKIKGVEGNIGQHGLCSIYRYDDAEKTSQMIENFRGGTAVFVMPPVPIKCAGAPQKIMYLAEEVFRRNGIREKSKVIFTVAGKVIFGVPSFAKTLTEVAARKGIEVQFLHKLVEVRAQDRVAIFEKTLEASGDQPARTELVSIAYDLLHVVPPMSAHDYVRESGLAFTEGSQLGWLKVDQHTLQHKDFPEIYGIGDVTGVPNSKTGAAIRKQAPIVVQNLLSTMAGLKPTQQYDGYSSCPLITGFGKVVLAEFGYEGQLLPSFPMDMTKERRSMWVLKKNLLPPMYWQGMMKGRL